MPDIPMKLRPFIVPNFAILDRPPQSRGEGPRFNEGVPLREVPAEALAELCDQFRAEVFRKARQDDPQQGAPHG